MKFKYALLPLFALSPLSQAAVTVELPNNINLLVVNEETAKQSHINADGLLEMPNGTNQFVFDFRRILKAGSIQSEHFESSPIVVTFDAEDEAFTFDLPKMNSMHEFRQFEKSPSVQLTNSQSQPASYEIDKLNKGLVSLLSNYENATIEYNKDNGIHLTSVKAEVAAKPVANTSNKPTVPSASVTQLKVDFEQLSAKEKQAFLSWAINNM